VSETVTLASWTKQPYTSYDKRHIAIHHRVRIVRYDASSADVMHERREGNGEWSTVAVAELRDYGMTHQKLREGVLQE
jgi:hypothetical protein